MRKFFTLVAVPAALSVALVAPAMARPTSATLTVSTAGAGATSEGTSQMARGSSLVFGGCGYQPGVGVSVKVVSPTAIAFFGGIAGSDGCFSTESTTTYTADDAGNYTASSYQSSRRKADASVSFTVTN